MTSDLISKQVAIDAMNTIEHVATMPDGDECIRRSAAKYTLSMLPSAQPTLYGYKIEHLAYIAMVMEKEGVTADYAVRTFDDMSRVIKMIIDEIQQKVGEALNDSICRKENR